MNRVFVLIAVLGLAACQPDAGSDPETPPGRVPDKAAQAQCIAEGGEYGQGGLAGFYQCFRPTPDAGQACTTGSDCSGLCLAETGTCSATTPLYGCQPILTENGEQAVICID